MPRAKTQYNVKDIVTRTAAAKASPRKKAQPEKPAEPEAPAREWMEPDLEMLDEAEIALWDHICENAPPGLITEADRFMLEMLCQLLVKMRRRVPMTREEFSTMNQLTSRFALTPKDRANMKMAPKNPEKKANKFEAL